MKSKTRIALLAGMASVSLLGQRPLLAQTCSDDQAMVASYQKDISELVSRVQKENLQDFEKAYHQKSSLTKMTLCLSAVGSLVNCLEKATHDPTATKEDVAAIQAKRDSYAKLKEKVQHERDALKAAANPKEAKALIEKFDLSNRG